MAEKDAKRKGRNTLDFGNITLKQKGTFLMLNVCISLRLKLRSQE